jgi:hypothetical protein
MHTATSVKRNVVRDSAAETTHDMISALRDVLLAAVTFEPAAPGATASIQFRACAVLYLLLCDHSVDQRGRCRSCRRSGGVLGLRRRLCRVHVKAEYWLRQPTAFLHYLSARELGLTDLPPAHDSAAVGDPAGLPPSDHGGVEELPERPRSRRAPFNDHTGRRTEVAPGAD